MINARWKWGMVGRGAANYICFGFLQFHNFSRRCSIFGFGMMSFLIWEKDMPLFWTKIFFVVLLFGFCFVKSSDVTSSSKDNEIFISICSVMQYFNFLIGILNSWQKRMNLYLRLLSVENPTTPSCSHIFAWHLFLWKYHRNKISWEIYLCFFFLYIKGMSMRVYLWYFFMILAQPIRSQK